MEGWWPIVYCYIKIYNDLLFLFILYSMTHESFNVHNIYFKFIQVKLYTLQC